MEKNKRFVISIALIIINSIFIHTLEAHEVTVKSNDGNFQITIELPDRIVVGKFYDIPVSIKCIKGECKNLKLFSSAEMPHHGHGLKYKPETLLIGGQFVIQGINFHMPGYWHLYFDIERGGIFERGQIYLEI